MGWQQEQRNADALQRLANTDLPVVVLQHASTQRRVPHLPRLAVDSYWRSHPIRADRLARALAARSGAPEGWRWTVRSSVQGLRLPPAPFREQAFARGAGFCCLCGQPVYSLGWHCDFRHSGELNRRAVWHACCVTAWRLWNNANQFRAELSRRQKRRCAATGGRLLRGAEVDHRKPLSEVWRERHELQWPSVLAYWGTPNLQVLSREAHQAKTIAEARSRGTRYPSARVDSPDCRFSGLGMPTMLKPAST